MALCKNKHGRFLVFLEGKGEEGGRINQMFLPKGDKGGGWWQMMEAIMKS